MNMDWILLILLIISFVGIYSLHVKINSQKYIPPNVRVTMRVEYTNEGDAGGEKLTAVFVKTCPFRVTPVIGTYFEPPGFVGLAVIKRVKMDDEGYVEIDCLLETEGKKEEFLGYCENMTNYGWHGGA
jgi:hypothetical protein